MSKRKDHSTAYGKQVCALAAALGVVAVSGLACGMYAVAGIAQEVPTVVTKVPVVTTAPIVPAEAVAEKMADVAVEEANVVVLRYANVEITAEERDELAAVIWLEARGESAEGQQAVAEVVLNRVIHGSFPDNVHDVIHQGVGTKHIQFTTAPMIPDATPSSDQYDAIDAALYGPSILPNDVVFFSRGAENDRIWGRIGGHVFCREYIWE